MIIDRFKGLCLGIGLCFLSQVAWAGFCDKPLLMGWDDYSPYQQEVNKQLQGMDIDLAKLLAQELGCAITFKKLPWARHLGEVKSGTVDLASSASLNAERQEYAYFSDHYLQTGVVLYVRTADLANYKFSRILDLKNYPKFQLGAITGYDYGHDFRVLSEDPSFQSNIQYADNLPQNIKKLANKRINGTLEDQYVFASGVKNLGLNIADFSETVSSGKDKVYFMISKKSKSPEFVTAFNAALKKIQESNEWKEILKKYTGA